MTASKIFTAAVSAVALMAAAAPTFAQAPAAPRPAAPAAAPAAPTVVHGPALPGVCVFDNDRILAESAVGKAASARLVKLQTDVQAELTAEQNSLVADARTFETQRATLTQDVQEQRTAALQIRQNALQRKADQRNRELQATEAKAGDRINAELVPVVTQVYQQRNCSLLMARGAAVIYNPAMDISPVVITALNSRISTLTFDRERLDPAPAAPQAR